MNDLEQSALIKSRIAERFSSLPAEVVDKDRAIMFIMEAEIARLERELKVEKELNKNIEWGGRE